METLARPRSLACTQLFSPRRLSFGPGLFDYTSGRYLFNEDIRRRERHLTFNPTELARNICAAIGRPVSELLSIDKFAEGGFNRILEATFQDGQQILARLPFKIEAPLYHSVASEAATLTFLRRHGIPVPKVYGYSPVADNPVGTQYILLEKLPGKPLSQEWFSLDNKALTKIMKQIVDMEQRFTSLALPASGSLYFQKDLKDQDRFVSIKGSGSVQERIVIGPMASYAWWYRERASMTVDRGPWTDFLSCFEAAADRELAFCKQHGKPRLHVEPYLRELQQFKPQHPSNYAELLLDYLKLAPFLNVSAESRFARPTLRHPDYSPSNLLINKDNEIVGVIDWQHTAILPLSLCAGIPKHYQNWGDPISESLQKPETTLPSNFDTFDASSQESIREKMRKRLIHFYYGALTLKKAEDHFDAIRDENIMLRAKLYDRASAPWEGDFLALEHALVQAQLNWPLPMDGSVAFSKTQCPLQYSSDRIAACLDKVSEEEDKLEELDEMREVIGIDSLGWVPDDKHLAKAKEIRDAIKEGLLQECTTETERIAIQDHFPFDDHAE